LDDAAAVSGNMDVVAADQASKAQTASALSAAQSADQQMAAALSTDSATFNASVDKLQADIAAAWPKLPT